MTKRKGSNSKSTKWMIRIGIGIVIIAGIMFLIHTIIQAHQ